MDLRETGGPQRVVVRFELLLPMSAPLGGKRFWVSIFWEATLVSTHLPLGS